MKLGSSGQRDIDSIAHTGGQYLSLGYTWNGGFLLSRFCHGRCTFALSVLSSLDGSAGSSEHVTCCWMHVSSEYILFFDCNFFFASSCYHRCSCTKLESLSFRSYPTCRHHRHQATPQTLPIDSRTFALVQSFRLFPRISAHRCLALLTNSFAGFI